MTRSRTSVTLLPPPEEEEDLEAMVHGFSECGESEGGGGTISGDC
jgi:hypothetical protein